LFPCPRRAQTRYRSKRFFYNLIDCSLKNAFHFKHLDVDARCHTRSCRHVFCDDIMLIALRLLGSSLVTFRMGAKATRSAQYRRSNRVPIDCREYIVNTQRMFRRRSAPQILEDERTGRNDLHTCSHKVYSRRPESIHSGGSSPLAWGR